MHVVVAVCLVQYTENRKSTHIVVVAGVNCTPAGLRRVGFVLLQCKGVWSPLAVSPSLCWLLEWWWMV